MGTVNYCAANSSASVRMRDMEGPRQMKYHYEYEVRIYKLCDGTMSLGRYKTYVDAITEVMNKKLSLFNIKKVRVYE